MTMMSTLWWRVEEPRSNVELSSSKTLNTTNDHDSTSESHQMTPEEVEPNREDDVVLTAKRKRNDDVVEDCSLHLLWKTSLYSYFQSHNRSCNHDGVCRYVHDKEKLCLHPNNTWDLTIERTKKALKTEAGEKRAISEEVMMTEAAIDDDNNDCGTNHTLSKCLVDLP
ncbi:hypothetical protein GYH30_010171 [Glycine max]|nr:hypothetical protein GYH30_010171 [Glycine max]